MQTRNFSQRKAGGGGGVKRKSKGKRGKKCFIYQRKDFHLLYNKEKICRFQQLTEACTAYPAGIQKGRRIKAWEPTNT